MTKILVIEVEGRSEHWQIPNNMGINTAAAILRYAYNGYASDHLGFLNFLWSRGFQKSQVYNVSQEYLDGTQYDLVQ